MIQNCVTRMCINLFCLASQQVKENKHPQFQSSQRGFLEQIVTLHFVPNILLQKKPRGG